MHMITIITDSSAYFKKEEAKKAGVRIVPMSYSVNGRNYFETYSDLNGDFESLLSDSGKFSTSHPNFSSFLSCFEEELRLGNEVLCITISSRLSGTYSTAYMAARQTESKNIQMFDSQLTAGGLHILVKEARKLADEGVSLPELVNMLPAIRDKITIAFSVDDMTPLRNSGRIGFVRMSVGTILNRKPILLCKEGVVVADEIARGGMEMLKKLFQKVDGKAKEIIINYIGNERMAISLYNLVREAFPAAELKLQKGGPVLGIHLGLQVVGISFLTA